MAEVRAWCSTGTLAMVRVVLHLTTGLVLIATLALIGAT